MKDPYNTTPLTKEEQNEKNLRKLLLTVSILALIGVVSLWHILFPFIIGICLAFVIDPFITMLEKNKIKRIWSSLGIALLTLILLLYFFIGVAPNLVRELSELISKISTNLQNKSWISKTVIDFLNHYNISINEQQIIDNIKGQLSHLVSSIFSSFIGIMTSGLRMIENVIISIFTLFFLLKEKHSLKKAFSQILPEHNKGYINKFFRKLFEQINEFVHGTIVTSFIIFLFMFIVLHAFNAPFATPLSIFSGFISLVPYLGPLLQMLTIFIVQIANFTSFTPVLGVLVTQIIFYIIVGFYLYPAIIGKSIQVHPLIVFTCTIIGGSIAGILGMLLAIPVYIFIRGVFLAFLSKYQGKENVNL